MISTLMDFFWTSIARLIDKSIDYKDSGHFVQSVFPHNFLSWDSYLCPPVTNRCEAKMRICIQIINKSGLGDHHTLMTFR